MKAKDGKLIPGFLRNLKLAEVSACGAGMNPLARVVLFKADDKAIRPEVAKKYASVDELPDAVKGALPAEAQAVFMRAVNAALDSDATEESAMKQAWTAVKNGWKKQGDKWVPKKPKPKKPMTKDQRTEVFAKAMYAVAESDKPGPKTFGQLIAEREAWRKQNEVEEKMWPLFSALNESIRSVAAEKEMSLDDKLEHIRQSVEAFMNAVADTVPDVEEELEKLLKQHPACAGLFDAGDTGEEVETGKEQDMTVQTEAQKLAAALEDISTLKAKLKETEDKLAAAETAKATAEEKATKLEKAAEVAKTDEVMSIGEGDAKTEVRKSVVGDQTWAMLKHQQAQIAKAEAERRDIEFAKKADTEIGTLPGTSVEKGKALQAVEAVKDEAVRKTLTDMLKAGAAALKGLTKSLGKDPSTAAEGDSASDRLEKMAKAYAAEKKIDFAKAYNEVLDTEDGKALYRESLDESRRAAA